MSARKQLLSPSEPALLDDQTGAIAGMLSKLDVNDSVTGEKALGGGKTGTLTGMLSKLELNEGQDASHSTQVGLHKSQPVIGRSTDSKPVDMGTPV